MASSACPSPRPLRDWMAHQPAHAGRQPARLASGPHRACPGGAGVCAPERGLPRRLPPPGWPRWSGGLRLRVGGAPHRPAGAQASAPPGPARWGRRRGGLPGGGKEGEAALLVQKPPLHRGKPGGGGSACPIRARPADGQPAQWRNRISFELISAQWTSSHALRLLAFLATCPSAASISPAFGSRDSVARYSSLSTSLSVSFFASSLPTRLVGARSLSST